MFLPQSEEKNWGRVTHVFALPHVAVSYLEVRAGQCCSRHVHEERANMFAMLDGCLVVEEWPEGIGRPSKLRALTPGENYSVPSGVWHRFRVRQSGSVIEVYWADRGGTVRLDDIERADVGSADNLDELRRELEKHGIGWPV